MDILKILVIGFFVSLIARIAWSFVDPYRCSECKRFFVMHQTEKIVLRKKTALRDGQARVTYNCKHCDYTEIRDETIRTYYPWEFI